MADNQQARGCDATREILIMKSYAVCAVAVMALASSSGVAMATDLTWTLENNSSHNVNYIYLSQPTLDEWGDDILGDDTVVLAGTTGTVTISDVGDACEFDIQLVMDTKQVAEHLAQDICSGLTLTISDQ